MTTKNIISGKIPNKITIVAANPIIVTDCQGNKKSIIPAFIVDAANEKSLVAAITWAKQYNVKETSDVIKQFTIDNQPQKGYQIQSLEVRGEGGRAYKVITPDLAGQKHSYYVDLREDVLMDTIQSAGILKGGILNDQFIWAKVGSSMKLIRYDSKLYHQLCNQNKRIAKDKIPNDQLQYGHWYRNLKGEEFIYLGWVHSAEIIENIEKQWESFSVGYTRITTYNNVIHSKTMLFLKVPSYYKNNLLNHKNFSINYNLKFVKSHSCIEEITSKLSKYTLEEIKESCKNEIKKINASELSYYSRSLTFAPLNQPLIMDKIFQDFWNQNNKLDMQWK